MTRLLKRLFAAVALAELVIAIFPAAAHAQGPRWRGRTAPQTVAFETDRTAVDSASRKGERGFRAIYFIDRDGKNAKYLCAAPGMLVNTDPALSPGGHYVAFGGVAMHPVMGNARLFVMALDGAFKGMIRDYGHGISPTWSPGGTQIAYVANPGNPEGCEAGVWVMDADGSDRRWLADAYFPDWSPKGEQLVVHLWRGQGTLGIIDVGSGSVRDILEGTGWSADRWGACWSGDGARIAFVGLFEGKQRLAILDAAATAGSIRILSTNDRPDASFRGPPAWSRDGKQIVFEIEETGADGAAKSFLYSMSAEVPSAPALLEAQTVGKISRAPSFAAGSRRLVFSAER